MPLFWYVAPVCTDPDCAVGGFHPGTSGTCPGIIPGLARIHAYDPAPNPEADPPVVPTTCLVGSLGEQIQNGWEAKTLGEAQQIFETHYGFSSTDNQVY